MTILHWFAISAFVVLLYVGVTSGWIIRRLLRLDEWVNYRLMNGRKRETISTRTYRAILRRKLGTPQKGDWVWYVLDSMLNVIDRDHCREAYEKDKASGKLKDPLD